MSYISLDKSQLVNLNSALSKEMLRANKDGSFTCTTVVGCNTRKYHGLLIAPQFSIDNDNHVFVSAIDETIIQNGEEFHLGVHQYANDVLSPKGHKYIDKLELDSIPKTIYRVGGVIFTKEMLYAQKEDAILIKYTLIEAHSETTLRIDPYLAFRNIHRLSKKNDNANTDFIPINNGIKMKLYPAYDFVHIQFSKKTVYNHQPDWYYNIEYKREIERGYEGHEDLLVPGYFEMKIEKGESIFLIAGLEEHDNPKELSNLFEQEVKAKIPRDNFENCLKNSAQQFIVKQNGKTEITAGFPWFGRWGRDTFISLPGLTLSLGDETTCKAVIDTMLSELNGPLFPNIGYSHNSAYNSIDAPLWFFWSLQQYTSYTGTQKNIWKQYGEKMKLILNGYRNGTDFNIHMRSNGLIYGGIEGKALTWMDAIVDGQGVTPRIGMPVEINALWYNAVMFSLEMAKIAKDKTFIDEWQNIADNFPTVFKDTFWSKEKGYLADVVNDNGVDWSFRPNQLIATALPYTPVSEKIRQLILEQIKNILLTPCGIRTLSPMDERYESIYEGDQATRDSQYHQGTVWPWLLGPFADGYVKIYGKQALPVLENIYTGFQSKIDEYCMGSIAEIYDAAPPHKAKGAISQAWSVAALIHIKELINNLKK